jgi:hypothetical protein
MSTITFLLFMHPKRRRRRSPWVSKGGTHHQRKRHNPRTRNQRAPPPRAINNQHLHHRAPRLERALDAAREQRRAVAEPERLEQRGEVILHGGGAAHVREELQQRGAPHARAQARVREERRPGEAGDAEDGDGALDGGELGGDVFWGGGAFAVEGEGGEGDVGVAVFDEPAWAGGREGLVALGESYWMGKVRRTIRA